MKTVFVLLALLAVLLNHAGAGHVLAEAFAAADRYGFLCAFLLVAVALARLVRVGFSFQPRTGVAR